MLSSQADELRGYALSVQNTAINATNLDNGARMDLLDSAWRMNKAADTIESLLDRLQGADVAHNDAEVLLDVAQALFRDLMRADPDMAGLWRRGWPELFGGEAGGPREAACENLIDPWGVHDVSEPDFECSRCHATGHADGNVTGGEYLFCPRCGAVVKKAVKR